MNIEKMFTKAHSAKVLVVAFVIIALTVSMLFNLSGCDKNDKPTPEVEQNTPTPDPEPAPQPAPELEPTPDSETETESDVTIIPQSKPSVSKPVQNKPVQNNPVQNTPIQNKPVENKPVQNKPTESTPTQPTPAAKTYTVTFKDYDGTVLKTQKVDHGKGADAPKSPSREHFNFAGWDKQFDSVTADITVTAKYTTDKTVIYAQPVSVNKGTGEVTMNINVVNNPGIMGAVLKLSVDDKVFAFTDGKNTAYPGLTLTVPGPGTKSSPYTFLLDAIDLSADDIKDGTLFTVTFKIKDTAATGKYNVTLSYDKGAVFDKNYNYPNVVLANGTITIK